MIDFRYHLVSIIAVFLALAVGLLVGATALSGKDEEALKTAQTALSHANDALSKANRALTQQVSNDQAFAQVVSPSLLHGLLPGENAVLIVAPGANSQVTSGVTTALRRAGATVTGQVQLTTQFMDPTGSNEAQLRQLAQSLADEAGVTLPAQSASSALTGQQDAALVLAASVVTNDGAGLSTGASQAVLNGFVQDGFVNSLTAPAPAELAVLVTPSGPPPASGSDGQVLAIVAQELHAASSATVMAGDVSSIGSGSAIDVEDNAGPLVSTVDNADTETGQIMVVFALVLALEHKAPAAYGIGPAAVPSPVPTPSASPSASTTPTAGGHK